MKFLFVEGQHHAVDDIALELGHQEHTVIRGVLQDNAKTLIRAHEPDVVLLIAIPFQDWHIQLLRELQGWEQPPWCLALTRPEQDVIVPLLRAGADAYCSDASTPSICAEQVLALARRATQRVVSERLHEVVRVRDLVVDFARYEVTFLGTPLAMTPAEFRILGFLVQRAGRVVSATTLFREALGYDVPPQQARDILKVHIRRIRKKIREVGGTTDYVCNIRGFGYLLERRTRERALASDDEDFETEEEATASS